MITPSAGCSLSSGVIMSLSMYTDQAKPICDYNNNNCIGCLIYQLTLIETVTIFRHSVFARYILLYPYCRTCPLLFEACTIIILYIIAIIIMTETERNYTCMHNNQYNNIILIFNNQSIQLWNLVKL